MDFSAQVGAIGADSRRSRRRLINVAAYLEEDEDKQSAVRVLDLSEHGFRMATEDGFPVDTMLWVKLPGLEALHARVVWSEGEYSGCEFEVGPHPASIELLTKMNAAPRPPAGWRRSFGRLG